MACAAPSHIRWGVSECMPSGMGFTWVMLSSGRVGRDGGPLNLRRLARARIDRPRPVILMPTGNSRLSGSAPVELGARPFDRVQVLLGPFPDAAERVAQAEAEVRQVVFDLRRDHRICRADDQAFALHFAQRLG